MIKAEVVSQIAQKTGLSKTDIQLTIEVLFETIQEALLQGERVDFRGFGIFANKKRAQKIARNIAQNTALLVEAHYVPNFTPSKTFASSLKRRLRVIGIER